MAAASFFAKKDKADSWKKLLKKNIE